MSLSLSGARWSSTWAAGRPRIAVARRRVCRERPRHLRQRVAPRPRPARSAGGRGSLDRRPPRRRPRAGKRISPHGASRSRFSTACSGASSAAPAPERATASPPPVRDARGLRESSRERMHRFCEHQRRFAFAERGLISPRRRMNRLSLAEDIFVCVDCVHCEALAKGLGCGVTHTSR